MKKITTSFFLLFLLQLAPAQTPFQPTSDISGTFFGCAVAISGDEILVSSQSSFVGTNPGKVYLFKYASDALTQMQFFYPDDVLLTDQFGRSVSIANDFIAVGAPFHNAAGEQSGAVYVYQKNGDTYNFLQKITAPNGGVDDHFGFVKIHGDFMFVGAPLQGPDNHGAVYVYIFDGTNWVFSQNLSPGVGTNAGEYIEAEGNTLVFAADNTFGNIYFTYELDTTTWQFKNMTEIATNADWLPVNDFSLSDNQLYVMTYAPNSMNESISIFNPGINSWVLDETFEVENNEQIQTKIEVSGDNMFLGSTSYTLQMERKFPVFHYKKTAGEWVYQGMFFGTSEDNGHDDYFGALMAVDGNALVIGSPNEFPNMPSFSGKAYYLDTQSLGVGDFDRNDIALYPNPVKNILNISNTSGFVITEAKIYSSTGSLLQTRHDNLDQLHFDNFASGLYFVALHFDNGANQTFKIAKN